MKKHILFGGMLLCAATFTACNEDFDDWASPQSNVKGDDAAAYGVTFAPGSQANVVMGSQTSDLVQLVSIAASSEDIASYVVKSLTVNGEKIAATVDGNAVLVSAAALDSIVEATTFDRSATPHSVEVVTEASAVLATGEAIAATGTTNASLTPYADVPEKDAKGYAMLGQWQGWDPSNPTWMTEVAPGVYEATVTTTDEGDNWFKFYKGSGFDEAEFGWDAVALGCAVNGDGSSPNLLVWENDPRFGGFQTPVISGAATWKVTLDMNKLYYKFEREEMKYFVVGDANGWSDADRSCLFYAHGGNVYSYATNWTNQWSLKIWDEKSFGNWDAAWGGVNGSTEATGSLVNQNAGAIGPNENGGYYIFTINMGNMTYEWTPIDTPATYANVSLIGDFNGWAGDVQLTQLEKAPHNWYVRYSVPSDGGLKFRADNDWAVSWGTSDEATPIDEKIYYLPIGSGNIKVPAGTYDFYLNDITGRWSIVKAD